MSSKLVVILIIIAAGAGVWYYMSNIQHARIEKNPHQSAGV